MMPTMTAMMTTQSAQNQLTPLIYNMLIKATKPTIATATATATITSNAVIAIINASIVDSKQINGNTDTSPDSNPSFISWNNNLSDHSNRTSVTLPGSLPSFITPMLPWVTIPSTIIGGINNNSSTNSTTTEIATSDCSYLFGMAWLKALIVAVCILLILITIVGNTLVILAVMTTRRLRTVTNCFVMNLAITDWLVGTCVMPPSVILYADGSWPFGWIFCDIWISLDVLLCTGSILSLCAISLDRYLAVTQPLTYSKKKRSKRLALFMIFIVWVTALSITCPPYLGWKQARRGEGYVICRYNQNKGYVVFSAMGSFFIPLAVMMYVYLKIGYVLTSRRQRIVRDANSERTADNDIDYDNFLSESEHFHCATPKFPSLKSRWAINNNNKKDSLKSEKCCSTHMEQIGIRHQASFYELVEISRLSPLMQCSTLSCKYGGSCMHTTTSIGITLQNGNEKCSNDGEQTSTLPQLNCADRHAGAYYETCLTTTTSTMTTTTLQNVKFSDIKHQQQQQSQQHQSNHNHQKHHHQNHYHHQHHRVPMRISTTKRDTKTAKTLTIVMGGFVVCWLPFFVYYLLIPFLPPKAFIECLQTFLTWIGWVNCAINPFIYAFYNQDFRNAFWRLTCHRICKSKQQSNHLAMFRG